MALVWALYNTGGQLKRGKSFLSSGHIKKLIWRQTLDFVVSAPDPSFLKWLQKVSLKKLLLFKG